MCYAGKQTVFQWLHPLVLNLNQIISARLSPRQILILHMESFLNEGMNLCAYLLITYTSVNEILHQNFQLKYLSIYLNIAKGGWYK